MRFLIAQREEIFFEDMLMGRFNNPEVLLQSDILNQIDYW